MSEECRCGSCGKPAEYLVDNGICQKCFDEQD